MPTLANLFTAVIVVGPLLAVAHDAQAAAGCTVTPSASWKSAVAFPDDSFRNGAEGATELGWIKFVILVCDPTTVYFQDSNAYLFHSEFAINELDPFVGMTPGQFDQVSLFADGQQAILGTIVMPPYGGFEPDIPEYGIQFVRFDPYTPEETVALFNVVKSAVAADPAVQALYFPTFEQTQTAEENSQFLADNGVIVSSTARWSDNNVCYAHGWALGQLKFVPADQIEAAYLAGTLRPEDILLTDGIPAEIPFVAGILSLAPSTPNSHVAILANTFNVPFAFLALPNSAARAQELIGRRIVLRTPGFANACDVRLIDVEGVLTQEHIDDILALKAPPILNIAPVAPLGSISANVDTLDLSDIQFFGGKAANFSLLRSSIPLHSPVAAALSFDVWSAFVDQEVSTGNTLREEIALKLAPFDTYPPQDFQALSTALDEVRDWFKDESFTSFSPTLHSAILSALQYEQYGFDPLLKIRFRSSTNFEDGDNFTGAGLFDSNSGCLADDLDGDELGPSLCDPTDANERGVFRALRRVFDSFYNDNAFLERLRHGVDETQVGMAVLVHHSFPDPIELANGVATLESFPSSYQVTLVTQDGAVSVTNPEPGVVPEEVQLSIFNDQVNPFFVSPSNLVPLGDRVLEWPADYVELGGYLQSVAETYAQVTGETKFLLDLEYKKVAPGGGALPAGGLVIKQVRKIPLPDDEPSITPFLINEPQEYFVHQGEFFGFSESSNVFSNHRLKSLWSFSTENLWMDTNNLALSFFEEAPHEYTDGCALRALDGSPQSFPQASHAYDEMFRMTSDSWIPDVSDNPRAVSIVTNNIRTLVAPAESPLLTLRDLGMLGGWLEFDEVFGCLTLQATYDQPVPMTNPEDGQPGMTSLDVVGLCPRVAVQPHYLFEERFFGGGAEPTITTSFYWPRPPASFIFGFTAPVIEFAETTIDGLTTDPIVLHGYYSQTYRPGHHNFSEQFLFEPRLEPGIPQDTLDELEAQDIRLIHVFVPFEGAGVLTYYDSAGVGQTCGCTLRPYADVNMSGTVDLDDILCVVDGSRGVFTACAQNDLDIAPCTGDAVIDVPDVVAVLDAFEGYPGCVDPCVP